MAGVQRTRLQHRLRALARVVTLRQAMLTGAAVVVVTSGLFGGLATATPEAPEELRVGRIAHAEPFDVTVQRVRWVEEAADGSADPDRRIIGVVATVTNASDHPVYLSDARTAVRLVDVEGIVWRGEVAASAAADPDVIVLADGSSLSTAPPGLSFDVVFQWEQSVQVDPPSAVSIAVHAQTWRRSSLDDQLMWFDPVVVAQGDVPAAAVTP